MGVSIHYTARRKKAVSVAERLEIDAAVSRFAVENQIEEYCRTGVGPNWESFCVFDPKNPTESGVVFEGATRLPDNSEDAVWIGLQHWCQLLTEIRHKLPGASWRVNVDDNEIVWDDTRAEFDPSQ